MPRPRSSAARSEVLSAPPRRAIVASAVNFQKSKIAETTSGDTYSYMRSPKKPSSEQWQTDAWSFYDIVGEFRYGVDWVASLASRVKLIVTKDGEETTDQPAVDALAALYGGPDGQADMMRGMTRHWTVAGDCYLIGDKIENPAQADWLIGAATQTTKDNTGAWKVNEEKFSSTALVIRLWRPHPVNRTLADSPARAALPVLGEIDGLTKHTQASVDSRLAGAGILFIPSEMTFGSARPEVPLEDADSEDPPQRNTVDELVQTLIDTMSTAVNDRADPSAFVPIVVQADGEAIKNVRYETFSSDLTKNAAELRAEAIRRLALSLDMPPEVLTGTADMNHWSSWQIEEAAIKAHLEPLLDELCASLTVGYLRPALGDGDDTATYAIEADTSALRLRPNRSKEAIELYNLGRLSGDTMLRENGFDPEHDAMKDDEFKRWMTANIARGSASPEQVQAALDALGVKLDVKEPVASPTDTREARPDPSTAEHPTRDVPQDSTTDPAAARAASRRVDRDEELVKASAVMVHRALERAGNRIKNSLQGAPRDPRTGRAASAARIYELVALNFDSMPVDKLLEDAWGTCDVFAGDLGVDPVWLTASLDAYARDLLQHSRPMHLADLRQHLLTVRGR